MLERTKLRLREQGFGEFEISCIAGLRAEFKECGIGLSYSQAGKLYRGFGEMDNVKLIALYDGTVDDIEATGIINPRTNTVIDLMLGRHLE